MKRRVVITGLGIASCLGNTKKDVTDSLYHSRSGIKFNQDYQDKGLRSLVSGSVSLDFDALIPRKARRFMADSACYAYYAMQQAIDDAQLSLEQVSDPRVGVITGSGGTSPTSIVSAYRALTEKGVKKIGPYAVTRTMSNASAACIATEFKIKGVNYSISSACATSAHCIGNAMEQIQLGKQNIIFAGGSEEETAYLTSYFDGMGALSTKYNDTPEKASRPYDANRDGFVIAGGAGIVVLEELEHALARGADIYAEIIGYGATSDGYNMVAPGGGGAQRCMQQALDSTGNPDLIIDYINTHGTSTPVGDTVEIDAIREVFGANIPAISSTKSISGHSLGAISVQEAIFCLLMMRDRFITPSVNIETLDPSLANVPIVTSRQDSAKIDTVLSNSFGFGGTNATLIFQRFNSN